MYQINAAIKTYEAIKEYKPMLVLNYGTAGSLKDDLHGFHEISQFVQRDMDAGKYFILLF